LRNKDSAQLGSSSLQCIHSNKGAESADVCK